MSLIPCGDSTESFDCSQDHELAEWLDEVLPRVVILANLRRADLSRLAKAEAGIQEFKLDAPASSRGQAYQAGNEI